MAKVDYDSFAGIYRMAEAEATIDLRSAVILTYHAALEREIDVVLATLLPRADKLRRNFGFANKIDVLAAAWKGEHEAGDRLHLVLLRFNDLRNSVAHGDELPKVEAWLSKLLAAYRGIDTEASDEIAIGEVAQGICTFMADDPLPREIIAVADGLERIMQAMPKALGSKTAPRSDCRP